VFENLQIRLHPRVVPLLVAGPDPIQDEAWQGHLERAREEIEASQGHHNGLVRMARQWRGDPHEIEVCDTEYAWIWAQRRCGAIPPEGRLAALGALMMIQLSDGRWVLSRRSETVDYGGWLTVSAGGFVDAGESWTQAMQRELHEELGIGPEHMLSCREVGSLSFDYEGLAGVDVIWHIVIESERLLRPSSEGSDLLLVDDLSGVDTRRIPTLDASIELIQLVS
jgi:8-oxo-dGTP pyrophosphatase MutT (NUDIX family)